MIYFILSCQKVFVKDRISMTAGVKQMLTKDDEGGRGGKPKDDNC